MLGLPSRESECVQVHLVGKRKHLPRICVYHITHRHSEGKVVQPEHS